MKVLIYGFKPYRDYKENVTEKIVRKITHRKGLIKTVFPVRFDKNMFLEKIKIVKPNIILGLGQCPRGNKIRIERKAVNLMKEDKKESLEIISRKGAEYVFVTFKLKKDKDSWISYDAGKYVCNFSIYIISNFSRHRNIKFAFLHIPKDYNVDKAVKFVDRKIEEMLSKVHE